jgi:hypothetical protein
VQGEVVPGKMFVLSHDLLVFPQRKSGKHL